MSLAVRVVPIMLVKGRRLVKGERFQNDRVVGDALQAARVHAKRGVDELMLLDVSATAEGRCIDSRLVEELTQDLFIPVTVGGGIKTVAQIKTLLRCGADKVLIGAAATPEFLYQAWNVYGAQAIVASIDYPTEEDVVEVAQRLAASGAGEILLNHRERDGTMAGYDLPLIKKVAESVRCPVIACGGCSGYEDMRLAIEAGASAVAAGALFQFTDSTPKEAAAYLKSRGIEVRQ